MYSSDLGINMEQEYVYANYGFLHKDASPVYGVESARDVRIQPLYFDELCYLLEAEGAHLILFGGPWCAQTQGVIDRVNFLAAQHGVDTVYHFDFRVDGESPATNFKADLTEQEGYDGPAKKPSVSAATCNYLYGELVTRYLVNAADWVDASCGTITYLNRFDDPVVVPNLREPFLFLYNKDNRVDYSGAHAEEGTYPIVCGTHLDFWRGEDGQLYRDATCSPASLVPDADALLEERIFSFVGKDGNDIAPYTHADYLYEAFRQNCRGHAFKTEDCFRQGEQINLCPITFAELYWLLQQKGTFLVFFCGAWCANSQAGVATVNDYAVANGVRVYMVDSRADGKHAIDFWGYPRANELALTMPALEEKYFEVWEERLAGAALLCKNPAYPLYKPMTFTRSYTDAEGAVHTIYPVDIPYLVAVNQEHTNTRGQSCPVIEACNHGGIELLNCSPTFVYYKPNYQRYCTGVYAVFHAYCASVGLEAKEKLVDRTAPLVEGEIQRNPNIKGGELCCREHNWYEELDENGVPVNCGCGCGDSGCGCC